MTKTTRRQFLTNVGAGAAAALLAGCGKSAPSSSAKPATGNATGSAPEITDLRFGIIALTDCSPIVIAHEKGFFKKHGINSTIVKGASWAAIRDALSYGEPVVARDERRGRTPPVVEELLAVSSPDLEDVAKSGGSQ